MRVAMFTDTWLPTMDGCVSSIQKFKAGLERRGHKVFIFAPEDNTGAVKEDDGTFLFKAVNLPQYPQYRMAISLSARKDQLLKEHDIQILHSHGVAFMGFKAMMSSRMLKIPMLQHFHTWVTEVSQYYPVNVRKETLEALSWFYLKQLCRRSDGVAAPSKSAIEELEIKVPGMAYTDWVFPGIDADKFNPRVRGDAVRERHGLEDKEVILHVGRLSMEKNLELVLSAMTIIGRTRPEARLLVVGDGPAKQHYKGEVKRLGLEEKVIFTGFVPDADLPGHYAASDTFVLASKFETLGIVMAEALATGKPVAGMNYRVIPHILKDGHNGYLFHDSAEDCARKVIACLDAPPEMGRNAASCVSLFDIERSTEKLEAIYRRTEEVHEGRMANVRHNYKKVLAST